MVAPEDTCSILCQSEGSFVKRLQDWSSRGDHSPWSLRIDAWLNVFHASARRGGNPGLFSETVKTSLPNHGMETFNLPSLDNDTDATTSVYDILSAPIFAFYLELQRISARIVDLSHYHRSRVTSADQEEVAELMTGHKARMYALWEARPSHMRIEPNVLRSLFCRAIAEPPISLIGICNAAYWTEIVEVGGTLSDPPLASPEAKQAMRHIQGDCRWRLERLVPYRQAQFRISPAAFPLCNPEHTRRRYGLGGRSIEADQRPRLPERLFRGVCSRPCTSTERQGKTGYDQVFLLSDLWRGAAMLVIFALTLTLRQIILTPLTNAIHIAPTRTISHYT